MLFHLGRNKFIREFHMTTLHRTIFFEQHKKFGAKLAAFGGWEMPIQYPDGILKEHMATRDKAGIFDVSHMGRLFFKGKDTVDFLQHVLTNNVQALGVGESQYTIIQNESGGALDDAYLYRFKEDEYLLVVNASNREKDLIHLEKVMQKYPDTRMHDKTFDVAMISLQGPVSRIIMEQVISNSSSLPELAKLAKKHLSIVKIKENEVLLARTGYTGEPIGFELFVENENACQLWDLLIKKGATPVGLGARDTLRLEACLPLYGHELGIDHDGNEIPLYASRLSKFAVSFSELKGNFIGKQALLKQQSAFKRIINYDYSDTGNLPKMIMPLAITGNGIGREGHKVFWKEKYVGDITSGTSVPYRLIADRGLDGEFKSKVRKRSIALALIHSNIKTGDILEIEIRNKRCAAIVVPYHMSSQVPPYSRTFLYNQHKIKKSTE
jgi:aminomethyltransferase